MKKLILSTFLLSSLILFSQDVQTDKSKFSASLHYIGNLDNEFIINQEYNGIIGINANYAFYQNEIVAISGGLGIDYLQEKSDFFKNDGLLFNPNISIEVNAFKSKFRPFFTIGYSILSYKINLTTINFDPIVFPQQTEESETMKGISINPGVRYHFNDLFFAEASYRYIGFDFSYVTGNTIAEIANTHYIQIGLGVKF